jgi:4-hydroxybenzoate polyprenyltransferase
VPTTGAADGATAAGPVAVAGHLVRAAHAGPGAAVTSLVVLLSLGTELTGSRTTLLGLAFLSGQLTVGWTNDLLDVGRDRAVGRTDKPVATGELSASTVRTAVALASAACVVLSLLCGVAAGLVHLLLGVAMGWAYNAGLKRTVWSWVPYAVAFGTLPAVVTLTGEPSRLPPLWVMACGGLLGVGAHIVNVLPDLADDAATGVRGLPHRLGEKGARLLASAVLTTASLVAVLGPPGGTPPWAWVGLAAAVALAAVTVRATGKAPFWAAVAIAVVDVVMLVLRS